MLKFCKRCNAETERYASGGCRTCMRATSLKWAHEHPERTKAISAKWFATHGAETSRAWREANPDKVKARAKRYREKHSEVLNERTAAWFKAHPTYNKDRYDKNPERFRAKVRAQRAKNPEKAREAYRQWRATNLEKARAATKAWERTHVDYVRQYAKNRSLRSNGWSTETFELAWKTQAGKCAICNRVMTQSWRKLDSAFADHDHATGLPRKLLCRNCNTGVGLFKDNPELMRKAALYVEEHK
jgi:Recombination endonuclease VII